MPAKAPYCRCGMRCLARGGAGVTWLLAIDVESSMATLSGVGVVGDCGVTSAEGAIEVTGAPGVSALWARTSAGASVTTGTGAVELLCCPLTEG
jgi:hypothetical protein